MKKMISAVLAICLACSMSVTAFAATVDETVSPKDVNTDITTTVNPTYTVTIPDDVEVGFNDLSTDLGEIAVDAARIHPDKCIKVTLNTDKTLNNTIESDKVIPYKVLAGSDEFVSASYLAAGEKTALSIAIEQTDWDKAYAGSYSDTITFTVAYADKTA